MDRDASAVVNVVGVLVKGGGMKGVESGVGKVPGV